MADTKMAYKAESTRIDGIQEMKQMIKQMSVELQKSCFVTEKALSGIKSQLHVIQERLSRLERNSKHDERLVNTVGRRKQNTANTEKLIDDVHKETITENFMHIVQNLKLNNTLLLDELFKDGCLTSDEASSVRDKPNRKDQVRRLMSIMGLKSKEKFLKFLSLLREDNGFMADYLQEAYDKKAGLVTSMTKCIVCKIKLTVNIKDVIDPLFQHKIVDFKFLEMVLTTELTHDQGNLWDALYSRIDCASDRRQHIKIFQEALMRKHEEIAAFFNINFVPKFDCHCNTTNQGGSSTHEILSESTGDISTTETRPLHTEGRSQLTVSDNIPSSLSDAGSQQGKLANSIPATVDWVVNAPFEIDNDYPELALPKATTQSHGADPKSKQCFGDFSRLNTPTNIRYARQHSPERLQNIGVGILKSSQVSSKCKIDIINSISSDSRCHSDISRRSCANYTVNEEENLSMEKDKTYSNLNDDKMENGKKNKPSTEDNISDKLESSRPGMDECNDRKVKKRNKWGRKRNKSEPNIGHNTITRDDNSVLNITEKSRTTSLDCTRSIEDRHKTNIILEEIMNVKPCMTESEQNELVESNLAELAVKGFDPSKCKQDTILFAHEQPIITQPRKVEPLMAGIAAKQSPHLFVNDTKKTKKKKRN